MKVCLLSVINVFTQCNQCFMAKSRQTKEQHVQELTEWLKTAKGAVLANFQGLKVKESEELRQQCRDQNVSYSASKKTLLKKILINAGYDVDLKNFDGGIAVVLGQEDEVSPAQIVANFAKKHELVKIFGGVLEGKFIDAAKVAELAKVPGRQELYARLVGSINAPVSGLVNVLAGNLRGLVNVLNAVKNAKV